MKRNLLALALLALFGLPTTAQDVTFEVIRCYDASGNDRLDAGEGGKKAMDNDLNTKWGCWGGDNVIVFKPSMPIALTGYTIVSANDNEQYGRAVHEWELYGSNQKDNVLNDTETGLDFNGWTMVSHVRADKQIYAADKTAFYHPINNCQTDYKYYALKIVAGNNQLSEFIPSYMKVKEGGFFFIGGTNPYAGEGADKAVDGNIDTKICQYRNEKDWHIIMGTTTPTKVTGYKFITGNDATDRDPKAWKLYGMNADYEPAKDDANWVLIDAKSGQTFPTDRKATVAFTVDTPTETLYNRFKLEIVETNGSAMAQFQEFSIDEVGYGVETNTITVYEASAMNKGSEDRFKAFDGSENTKWGFYGGGSVWVTFGINESKPIYGYKICTANNWGDTEYNRIPTDWKFYGANGTTCPGHDDAAWVEIDAKASQGDVMINESCANVYFVFDDPVGPFKYFRWDVEKTKGNTQFQVGEFTPLFDRGDKMNYLTLDDKRQHLFLAPIEVKDLTYSRSVTGKWSTTCLPFFVEGNDDVAYYAISGTTGSSIVLAEIKTPVPPYTPVILCKKGEGTTLTFNEKDVKVYPTPNRIDDTPGIDWTIKAGYATREDKPKSLVVDATGKNVYALTNQQLCKATESITVAPMRAYFEYSGSSLAPAFTLGDGETAIANIGKNLENDGTLYDLSGRSVETPRKGEVYILGGMKVMFK
ncbi:MAG: hypothetical protein HUK03_04145 [Bacteroidaceae bacterium]|nr:hypothetical protein [Bacteroidaceae bacterium]